MDFRAWIFCVALRCFAARSWTGTRLNLLTRNLRAIRTIRAKRNWMEKTMAMTNRPQRRMLRRHHIGIRFASVMELRSYLRRQSMLYKHAGVARTWLVNNGQAIATMAAKSKCRSPVPSITFLRDHQARWREDLDVGSLLTTTGTTFSAATRLVGHLRIMLGLVKSTDTMHVSTLRNIGAHHVPSGMMVGTHISMLWSTGARHMAMQAMSVKQKLGAMAISTMDIAAHRKLTSQICKASLVRYEEPEPITVRRAKRQET